MLDLLNQITTGDARELAQQIPDESIDLIFTDPVYERIEDYAWLGELAMRVLKPNSACLAWTSTRMLARAQLALEQSGLNFQWIFYYASQGKNTCLHLYGVLPKATPLIFLSKGRKKASPYLPDLIIDNSPPDFKPGEAGYFAWQKNKAIINRYLASFSKPGQLVLDPFTGSGTVPVVCKQTGRQYIAFEIEADRAEAARQRVLKEPFPMFLADEEGPKQTSLELAG